MRTSTAYFVGAGTVVAAVVAGLGGGLLIANTVSPHSSKEMTKLERRMSSEPIPVTNAASEPVSYLAATEAAATKPVVVAPAPDHVEPQPVQQTEAVNNSPAAAQPAEATEKHEAPAAQPSTSPQAPAPAAQSAARGRGPSPNAFARARDADGKRASMEKRRSERRQQWAEKRRYPRDQELRDVEQKVREETEPTQGSGRTGAGRDAAHQVL